MSHIILARSGLSGNPNLTNSVKVALRLGVAVSHKTCTGELVFRHPSWRAPVTVNARRKSTPNILLMLLRRLARAAPHPSSAWNVYGT